jgi:hypothetical protein
MDWATFWAIFSQTHLVTLVDFRPTVQTASSSSVFPLYGFPLQFRPLVTFVGRHDVTVESRGQCYEYFCCPEAIFFKLLGAKLAPTEIFVPRQHWD